MRKHSITNFLWPVKRKMCDSCPTALKGGGKKILEDSLRFHEKKFHQEAYLDSRSCVPFRDNLMRCL